MNNFRNPRGQKEIHSSQDHEIRHHAIAFFGSVNETKGACNSLKKRAISTDVWEQ